jgi:hypothetical protein
MAMGMKLLCLFLVLSPCVAVNLRSRDGRTSQSNSIPLRYPDKRDLERGFAYSSPVGEGCKQRPQELDKFKSGPSTVTAFSQSALEQSSSAKTLVKNFNIEGWSGFCEMGWSLCPDAKANKDYMWYAKGLGRHWAKKHSRADKYYCELNGWLKPDIVALVPNFEALQAKGKELCQTKYAKYVENATLADVLDPMLSRLGGKKGDTWLEKVLGDASFSASKSDLEPYAIQAAARQCALGDLACDIAYCNYAYCEKGDDTIGVMKECKGWDKVHGMP